MIDQIVAFKTSNGKCFEDKVSAYQEEIVAMYQLLPKVGKRGFSLVEMAGLTSEVSQWKDRARAVLHRMNEEVETDDWCNGLRKSFGLLVGELDTWIEDVCKFQAQMRGEVDPDAKKDIAHRKQAV